MKQEDILDIGRKILVEKGPNYVTYCNIAKELNITSDEVYKIMGPFELQKKKLIRELEEEYKEFSDRYVSKYTQGGKYEAYGMAYIQFAKNHKHKFEAIFMRSREGEPQDDGEAIFSKPLKCLMEQLNLDFYRATRLNIDMWLYIHGIATIFANDYISLEDDTILTMLRETFYVMTIKYGLEKGKDY